MFAINYRKYGISFDLNFPVFFLSILIWVRYRSQFALDEIHYWLRLGFAGRLIIASPVKTMKCQFGPDTSEYGEVDANAGLPQYLC